MKVHLAGSAAILILVVSPAASAQEGPQNVLGSPSAARLRLQVPLHQHLTYVSVQTNFVPTGNVRPDVAQLLEQAVQLAKAVDRNPSAVIAKFNQAAAIPGLNRDENNALARVKVILFGAPNLARPDVWDAARMRPSVTSHDYLPPGDVGPNNPN